MKKRKDFYKYNFILALALFLIIVFQLDSNATKKNSNKNISEQPDFRPKRYLASQQKINQAIILKITPKFDLQKKNYILSAEVDSLSLQGKDLSYKWNLLPHHKLISGNLTGSFNLNGTHKLEIQIQSTEEVELNRVRLEVFSVHGEARLGNVKSVDINAIPKTESEMEGLQLKAQVQSFKSSHPKLGSEIEELSSEKPKFRIRQ